MAELISLLYLWANQKQACDYVSLHTAFSRAKYTKKIRVFLKSQLLNNGVSYRKSENTLWIVVLKANFFILCI